MVNYGFVIDNRKCIGCHACTVACKSEHEVPIGVNRTHVKYIEKGEYPNTTRSFSVTRCNHCEDAPCTTICPTSALWTRADGIVDFDNDRCIGCKSCMQACPYDALYIDPNNHTAAKCNYCAHRVDVGFEPACVVVCPVEAIVSGDLDDADSHISRLLANESAVARKPEKATVPNLWYIEGDSTMLTPAATEQETATLWGEQAAGVGHFAKYAEARLGAADTHSMLVQLALEKKASKAGPQDQRVIADVMHQLGRGRGQKRRRVYDSPSKGVLWGWELPAYIWAKAIATGTFLAMALWMLAGAGSLTRAETLTSYGVILGSLGLTGAFLIKDLDRPDRFLYVLLRPNWSSWLVRGAYILSAFGGLVTLMVAITSLRWEDRFIEDLNSWLLLPTALLAVMSAGYTAFLLAQAKARDLWSSPLSAVHMVVHALMAGSVVMMAVVPSSRDFMAALLLWSTGLNLTLILLEVAFPHGSTDARRAVEMMRHGHYAGTFRVGVVLGSIVPILLLCAVKGAAVAPAAMLAAGGLALVGILVTEHVRIRVPQLIPLS